MNLAVAGEFCGMFVGFHRRGQGHLGVHVLPQPHFSESLPAVPTGIVTWGNNIGMLKCAVVQGLSV